MAMTLTGFVYDNAGNAISGATVQGYVSADAASSTAEDSVTTDSNGKWAITTSTASRVPMDVKITYGSNVRWIKAGDKVNVTDMTVTGTLTVGEDDSGFDVKLYGATSGSFMFWDESDDTLKLTDSTPLKIGDGSDMTLYHNGSDSYITNATGALRIATENSGIAVTIGHTTSEVTIGQNLTVTGTLTLGSGAELSEAELEMLDGITAGTAAASKALVLDANKDIGTIRNLTIDGTLSDGNYTFDTSGNVSGLGTVASGAITTSGVLDITDATDSSDATGDTGALRTEGGASIAKKLYVGDDASVGGNLTVTGNLNIDGTTTTVDSTTVAVGDSMISLAKDQGTSADAVDFGIYGTYGVGGTAKYAGIFRDLSATGDPWTFFDTLEAEPGTTVNTSGTGYDLADISAGGITAADGFTGDLTGDVTGNADTVTTNANLTGDVTSSGNAASIASNVIVDADVNSSAAIAYSKLAALSDGNILVGNGSNVATSVNPSGDVDVSNAGVFSIASGVIVDADVNASAAIAVSKTALSAGTNITLATNTLNVDDAFLINSGNDTTSGTITAAGFTAGDAGQVYFSDTAPASDHTATGVVISIASGESVAAFNSVYIRSDGEVGPADADAASTMPAIGVALEAKGDGEATKILVAGVLRDDTYNFTPGADLFIGTTAGEITATAPSGSGDTVQKVGVALTADSIYVNFNTTEVLLA